MRSAIIVTATLTSLAAVSDDIQYWPNGETGSAPYFWMEKSNWAEKVKIPTESLGRIPASDDTVYLAANELSEYPLEIKDGDAVNIASLILASGDKDNIIYGKGQGTKLKMSGGTLTTVGDFTIGYRNTLYGVFDLLGGQVSVGGDFVIGKDNASATMPSVLSIAQDAELRVVGTFHVGQRSQNGLSTVTNAGNVSVGALVVGPNNNNYISSGSFCNLSGANLAVSGQVLIPGSGKSNPPKFSSGELVLEEGSTFKFEGSTFSIGGAPGKGLLLSEIATDLSSADKVSVGNNGASTGTLQLVKSAWLKAKNIEVPSMQNGTGVIEMKGNSVIDSPTIGANVAGADIFISLHDNAAITNLDMVILGPNFSSRANSSGHLYMDGNSRLVFNPNGENKRFFGGSQPNGWLDVTLAGQSAIQRVKTFDACNGTMSGSTTYANVIGADLTFAGGTISFDVASADGTLRLGATGSTETMRPVVHAHGYGTITRSDMDELSDYGIKMYMPCPVWSVVADGGDENRDFDFRAVGKVNDVTNYGNKSGTNGWFAVSKGRLIYPRANPLSYESDNPVRGIGDHFDLGKTGLPVLLNSAAVTLPSDFEPAYLYAALYATNRDDVPTGIPVHAGKTIAVWRLGLAEDWRADDPVSPVEFSDLNFTFCYDVRDIPDTETISKVCLWRHDGSPDGVWRRVAYVKPEIDVETGNRVWPSTISVVLSSENGAWNGGFIAVGAQTRTGTVMVVR